MNTATVTIKGEEYGIRKLSWRTLRRAREARQMDHAQVMRAYGGDVLKGLRGDTLAAAEKQLRDEKEDPEAKRQARYDAHDMGVVLGIGVASVPRAGELAKNIEELDEEEADTLHKAILDLSLPALDPVKAAAEGKGDSGASISS